MATTTIQVKDVFSATLRTHTRMSEMNMRQTVRNLLAPFFGITKKRNDDVDNLFMRHYGDLSNDADSDMVTINV